MNEATVAKKLAELIEAMRGVPASSDSQYTSILHKDGVCRPLTITSKTLESTVDSLDWLRVSIKYLLFDLEATRRENSYLRRLVEDSHSE